MPILTLLVSHGRGRTSGGSSTNANSLCYQPSLRGEANEFASDFCRMHHRGSWIIHDDIRCARQKQSLKEQLVGTWTLLSWEQKKGDGTKLERYGINPKGIAFFDGGGRYIITDAIRSR
jgi:hypothetical protein